MTTDYTLLHGDCLALLPTLDACSIDACVTDPPYDLTSVSRNGSQRINNPDNPYGRHKLQGFMGKDWDGTGVAFRPDTWAAILRVMKPGAYLLAAGGTRTYHRMVCAIEDAGFIVKDCLMWLYGSGFPKSHDISKALDRMAGAEREVVGINEDYLRRKPNGMKTAGAGTYGWSETQHETDPRITAPATDLARQWSGYGTALKPAYEPLVLAQKPLDGTYAANVAEWGCGALNIDGCRIGTTRDVPASHSQTASSIGVVGIKAVRLDSDLNPNIGRWPANILLDEAAAAELDRQSGEKCGGPFGFRRTETTSNMFDSGKVGEQVGYGDTGGASRFFYVAKASRSEREQGLADYARRNVNDGRQSSIDNPYQRGDTLRANTHPTVKPVSLMRYLVRLVTPPNGLVLDPFMGSGSTGVACMDERRRFVGIEMEAEYIEIARSRIETAAAVPYQETLL